MIYFYSVDKPTDTQLSSSSEPVEEGKSLVITCTARANPSAEYKFYRDNKLISSSSTGVLSFVSAKNDDQGTYRCVPHNILGEGPQATLTVTVKGMYMKIAQLRLPKLGMGYSGKSLYCSFSWAMGVRAMSQYQWVDTLYFLYARRPLYAFTPQAFYTYCTLHAYSYFPRTTS